MDNFHFLIYTGSFYQAAQATYIYTANNRQKPVVISKCKNLTTIRIQQRLKLTFLCLSCVRSKSICYQDLDPMS